MAHASPPAPTSDDNDDTARRYRNACCHDSKNGNNTNKNRRWMMYTYSFTAVSCAAGVVYGWPALRQALRNEESQADNDDNDDNNNITTWSETALGAAFTAGAVSTQGLRFVTGCARDAWGTRRVTAVCLTTVAVGSVGIAVCQQALPLGMALFAQGVGAGVQLSVQPVVARLFPNHAGTVVSSLSGAFQISGLVYLVILRAFDDNRRRGFLSYAALLLVLAVVALWLLPRGLPQATNDKEHENVSTLSNQNANTNKDGDDNMDTARTTNGLDSTHASGTTATVTTTTNNESQHNVIVMPETETSVAIQQQDEAELKSKINDSEITPQRHSQQEQEQRFGPTTGSSSAWEDVKTWKFVGLVQWFSLVITPLQYYVGSIAFQLEEMGDTRGKYSDLFSILYGCASILSPAGGYLADRYTLGLAHGLATALCAASFVSLALHSQIPLPWQSVGLACNATGRMWVFGTYFAHVGRVFGYQHYGTLAGLGLLISALVSLLQYPLLVAAAHGHATAMNLICGGVLTAQLLYCYWLHHRKM